MTVISSPAGWQGDWHPAPRRQVMFVLAGELEVRVSDGEVRRFGPGAMLLVEDTTGTGHVSSVVGADRAYMVNVPLADQPAEPHP
jgi:quercetin dioxygenase-like cupin family protein